MDASDHAAGDERLTENQMLRMALDNMPHGLCMFDGADKLLLANWRFAQLWDIPEELTRPGTSYATNKAAVKGFEMPHSLAQPNPPAGSSGVRRREWRLNDGRTIGVVVTRLPDATQWPANVRVAVNASQVQFSKGHVLNDVRAALEIRAGARAP